MKSVIMASEAMKSLALSFCDLHATHCYYSEVITIATL